MTNMTIIDHLTGQTASGIEYEAIGDAVRGWREPWGLDWENLEGVEILDEQEKLSA
ncbi:MAG: hypothetical protein Q4P36_02740 [Bowdeniella nasicola]|nr:hypothetical protein [Bowdeniella nasicola]